MIDKKQYKKIGQGQFSSVYRRANENKVIIVSRDPVKECMSLGWFPDSRLFPKVERLSINDDGTQTYSMRYYDKVTAPKKQLNDKSYELYKALRDLWAFSVKDFNLHEEWIKQFKSLPKKFRTAKEHLISAVEACTNYGPDVCFEISPRNIAATKTGNLILLDCFFMRSKLKRLNNIQFYWLGYRN